MTNEIDHLIHRYADGDLSGEDLHRFEQMMQKDAGIAARVAEVMAQTEWLRAEIPQPPDDKLDRMLEHALSRRAAVGPRRGSAGGRLAAALALLALGAAGGFGVGLVRDKPSGPVADLEVTATAAHVLYAAEVVHPVEVSAGRQDHLQGWLSNRLGAEISAPDLTAFDYALVGGRLLPFAGQGAAQFMYEAADGSRLTLYAVTSDQPGQRSFRFRDDGALLAVTWQEGIWRYALIGAAGRQVMSDLARHIYAVRL